MCFCRARVRGDGSERTRLNDDSAGWLNVVGEWIYYINWDDGKRIYRVRIGAMAVTFIESVPMAAGAKK